MRKFEPRPPGNFVRAIDLQPQDKLLEWLSAQQGTVRLPILLAKGDVGFSLRGARINTTTIEVLASDSALGIGLADHARQHCKDQPTCPLWLEGRWRIEKHEGLVFNVTRMHRAIEPAELASATFAELEQ